MRVGTEDLRDTAAEVLVDLEDTRPGILDVCSILILCWGKYIRGRGVVFEDRCWRVVRNLS